MKTIGIICEYNPLHNGHKKQLNHIRAIYGADCGIVCLMSGNYVQRGHPAIIDKQARAKAAILSGADLVLELPVTASLSSAEGFAAEGVRILSSICDSLCFGAEIAQSNLLMHTAEYLLSTQFSQQLRVELEKGVSFPAARQAALESAGMDGSLLSSPNNILAVEYCKAILSQNSSMNIMPICRQGDYHDLVANMENPSATAVRSLMLEGKPWQPYIPHEALAAFENATHHTLAAGERAILARLRCMTESDFEALPFGSEGLWRKLMYAINQYANLEEIITAVKSKRYTRTRIDRMILCAYLGITQEQLTQQAPYIRVLALNSKGGRILKSARENGEFINIGQPSAHPYQALETKWGGLYGMFAIGNPDTANAESCYRVFCCE